MNHRVSQLGLRGVLACCRGRSQPCGSNSAFTMQPPPSGASATVRKLTGWPAFTSIRFEEGRLPLRVGKEADHRLNAVACDGDRRQLNLVVRIDPVVRAGRGLNSIPRPTHRGRAEPAPPHPSRRRCDRWRHQP